MNAGFSVETRGGFHITFDNGASVSVQIGPGTYSDNYHASFDCFLSKEPLPDRRSSVAEIAIMVDGKCVSQMYNPDCWGVLGHQDTKQFLDIVKWVAALSAEEVRQKAQEVEESHKQRMAELMGNLED